MVTRKHTKVIEGRRLFNSTGVHEPDETAKDGVIDNYGCDQDEQDESGSGDVGVTTGVSESETNEVEEVHHSLKYPSILTYMLKHPSFITQGFKQNMKSQQKIFGNMCDFGSHIKWRRNIRAIIYYIDVETRKYQERLINPTSLYFITGQITEYTAGHKSSKNVTHQRLNLIYGSFSSYCSILNSPKWIDIDRNQEGFPFLLSLCL